MGRPVPFLGQETALLQTGRDCQNGSTSNVTEPMMALLERAGVCTLDCPDTCSLTVTVDDDRIVKVRGSHALPYTRHQSGSGTISALSY